MEIFIASFITLFVIVDPIGVAAIFATLTRKEKPAKTRMIALRATLIASAILIIFGFGGYELLKVLHISIPAFRIAGGLLLFVTAFRMLMGFHDQDQLESGEGAYKDLSNIAIFPMSIPLLAGPGCMTAVMLHMTTVESFNDKLIVMTAIIVVQGLALISMLCAKRLLNIFGEGGSSLIARIIGILLAGLSIQFIADGLIELFPALGSV